MSSTTVVPDALTMVRRSLLHAVRYPSLTVIVVGMPVVFLLLFVYVFGGTLGAGLSSGGNRGDYLAYVVPGLLVTTVVAGATTTAAITVARDMTEGIVARFRTMAISRSAVLAGHVLGTTVQTVLAVTSVLGLALVLGFRPHAGPVGWLTAASVLVLVTLALTWLSVALGMVARDVESASNLPMPLLLLPFLGSGFVPTGSMPGWLRWFAENQPCTAFIETVRALLGGGGDLAGPLVATVGWAVAIGAVGWVWALRLYERRSVR